MQILLRTVTLACALTSSAVTLADNTTRADSHAPMGVMADHTHARGEWMFSYRFMTMDMDGNRLDTRRIDPDTIVTTQPNRFAGQPMQPPTLRIVPLDMRMDMHMFGVMYAPTDRITLMGMFTFLDKTMKHRTYQGGAGSNVLGNFETESSGRATRRLRHSSVSSMRPGGNCTSLPACRCPPAARTRRTAF